MCKMLPLSQFLFYSAFLHLCMQIYTLLVPPIQLVDNQPIIWQRIGALRQVDMDKTSCLKFKHRIKMRKKQRLFK